MKAPPRPPVASRLFTAREREAHLTAGFPFKARRKAVKTRHRTPMMGTIARADFFRRDLRKR